MDDFAFVVSEGVDGGGGGLEGVVVVLGEFVGFEGGAFGGGDLDRSEEVVHLTLK